MSAAPITSPPRISVVICAYSAQRLPNLRSAVPAVLDQLRVGDELIVVIDHNDELLSVTKLEFGTAGQAPTDPSSGLGLPAVLVTANQGKRGLSEARNTGIAMAQGELVAFLDDDALPRAGWLDALTAPFKDEETIGAGGLAIPSWETKRPAWLPEEFLWVVGCSYQGLPRTPSPIRNPIGANMAFRRSVFQSVGGFTDGIGRIGKTPLGCEETEFSIRAVRRNGGQILQQPTAIVDHLVTSDRMTVSYFVRRCWAEGISKAAVSRLTGNDAALQSERSYTTRTLPAGVVRGLWAGLSGDPGGPARAAVIVLGLAITVAGYLRGTVARVQPLESEPAEGGTQPRMAPFVPLWSGQIELSEPALPVRFEDSEGLAFERARLLVRAGGTPLGFVQLDTPNGRIELTTAARAAEKEFGAQAAFELADAAWRGSQPGLITIVLCTHDRAEGVRRAIDSFMTLRHRKLEIIVVDNAPSDETTRNLIAEFSAADPRVRYVCEPKKGLSWARNTGLREATGEIVAFTDDDVRVDPLWVNGLLRGFARRSDVACVTGLVASSSLARAPEQYFDQRVWWSSSCTQQTYTAFEGAHGSRLHPYAAGKFGTGANFAARTATLRSIGGFDQCLGAGSPTRGGEDLDIFVRILTAGHALSYEPSALVWHDHRVDESSLRDQMYAYGLGLTAYLTKYALSKRSRRAFARRTIGGSWHLLILLRRSRTASADAHIEAAGLTRMETRGMLLGPVAYLRARRRQTREHLEAVAP